MNETSRRYNEIDFLRGIACLSVVAFHYCSRGPQAGWMPQAWFPGLDTITRYGYLGVDLFFLISGFVILMSARNATPREFLASRVARLFPAFWVAVTLTAGTAWFLHDGRFEVPFRTYLINLSMVPHWFDVPYVDGAYWSLAVELHFYIMVWLLIRLRLLNHLEWIMLAWLGISFINAVRPVYMLQFWLNAGWAPLFVAGGAFYLIRTSGFSVLRICLLGASYGLAVQHALQYARLNVAKTVGLVEPVVVVASISAIFAVFLMIAVKRWQMKGSWLTATLGALTYPLYVIHQNFGMMIYGRLYAAMRSPVFSLLLTIALVFIISMLVHRHIEKSAGPRLRQWIKGGRAQSLQAAA